jgi:hypothetical protein
MGGQRSLGKSSRDVARMQLFPMSEIAGLRVGPARDNQARIG